MPVVLNSQHCGLTRSAMVRQSLPPARGWLEKIALFVHHMAAEAIDIIGQNGPRSRAAREDVRVRLHPGRVIVSTRVNDLKGWKPLQGYAEACAAGRAKCVMQKSSVIWRAVCVRTGCSAFEIHGLLEKDELYGECASGDALAERAMANRDLDRRPRGSKTYGATQAAAFMNCFVLAVMRHSTPPVRQSEGK